MHNTSSDFNEITDHLYAGARLNHGDWYVLASLNITVNINLQAESQDRFAGATPEVSLWVPTPDWFGPGIDKLQTCVRFIRLMIAENRKVYVHCNAGIGRAPTVATAYLISTGMHLQDALNHVRLKRPRSRPNDEQIRQLTEFERIWRAKQSPNAS
jgi:protein-tyrosine phosphatase